MIDKKRVLSLVVKKKWFDMIASGEKQEEYRELTNYWAERLFCKIPLPSGGYLSPWYDIQRGDYDNKGWKKAFGREDAPIFEEFREVEFRNGYGKDSPKITLQFRGIEIRAGNTDWGAEKHKRYFVIKLGVINKNIIFA